MPNRLNTTLLRVRAFVAREEGQGITEYALVIALIGLVAVVALTSIGGGVTHVLTSAGRSI